MKNIVKVSGVIALAALIAAAASAQAGGFTASWPPANVLATYGIQGLAQPDGITNVQYAANEQGPMKTLTIVFVPGPATEAAVTGWFTANGWIGEQDGTDWDFYNPAGKTAAYGKLNDSNFPAGSYFISVTSL
jgi:hypothetical protein